MFRSTRVTASLCGSLNLKLGTALYHAPIIVTVWHGTPKNYGEKEFKLCNPYIWFTVHNIATNVRKGKLISNDMKTRGLSLFVPQTTA